MTILTLTQVIDRPVETVFATLADVGNFAAWNPTIRSSRQLTPGAPGEGSRFEWKLRGFGIVRQELREFEPDRELRIVPEMRSISGGHRFRLSGLGPSTRVDHELEMSPRGFFKLTTPMIRMTAKKNLHTTAAALKEHLEGS